MDVQVITLMEYLQSKLSHEYNKVNLISHYPEVAGSSPAPAIKLGAESAFFA